MNSLVGFRFKPTDDEIICLLKKKRLDPDFSVHTITEIKFYNFEPWELPGFCLIQSQEEVWYFYCEPYYKYAKSKRAHRRTKTGYWKVTGKGSKMKAKKSRKEIGTKKILSFCSSKNPNTEWVMHEISVEDDPLYKKNFVICRLERKRDTKLGMSASDEYQSSSELASCSSIDVSNNVFMESVIPLDQPVDSNRSPVAENTDNSISHSRDGESTSLESILPPNQHLVSDRNHVAETQQLVELNPSEESSYSCGSVYDGDSTNPEFYTERIDDLISSLRALQDESSHEDPEFKSSKSDEISGESVVPLDQRVVSNRSPIAENTDNSISHFRNAKSTSLESILPPNQHLVSNRDHVAETRQLAELNPSEESSYSSGSIHDCDSMNPEFYPEWIDDLINSPGALQDESSHEDPEFKSSKCDEISGAVNGQPFSPDFNWAKWNRSDMDTETFCEWTKSVFEIEKIYSLCMLE